MTSAQCKALTVPAQHFIKDYNNEKTCITKTQCTSSNIQVENALCLNPEKCVDNLYANSLLKKCTKYADCKGDAQYVNFNDKTCLT